MAKYEDLLIEYREDLIGIDRLEEEYDDAVTRAEESGKNAYDNAIGAGRGHKAAYVAAWEAKHAGYQAAEGIHREWMEALDELEACIEAEYIGAKSPMAREQGIRKFWKLAEVGKRKGKERS
uniref:Uncharacterized protein n=1 Tax=viral metagenome TaxID=1070528 RepID=A0A6M3K9G3_9ZZZZ